MALEDHSTHFPFPTFATLDKLSKPPKFPAQNLKRSRTSFNLLIACQVAKMPKQLWPSRAGTVPAHWGSPVRDIAWGYSSPHFLASGQNLGGCPSTVSSIHLTTCEFKVRSPKPLDYFLQNSSKPHNQGFKQGVLVPLPSMSCLPACLPLLFLAVVWPS